MPTITIVGVEAPCAKLYASGRRKGTPCVNPPLIRIDGEAYCGQHARSEMLGFGSPSANEIVAMAVDADRGCRACSRLYSTRTYTQGSYGWRPWELGDIGNVVRICDACYERYTRCTYIATRPNGDVESCHQLAIQPDPPMASIDLYGVEDEEDSDRDDGYPGSLHYCEDHYQIVLCERQQEEAELRALYAEDMAAEEEENGRRADEIEQGMNEILDWLYPRLLERLRADGHLG